MRIVRNKIILLSIVSLALLGSGVFYLLIKGIPQPNQRLQEGKILFTRENALWSVNPDGSDKLRLYALHQEMDPFNKPFSDYGKILSWSPTARELLFSYSTKTTGVIRNVVGEIDRTSSSSIYNADIRMINIENKNVIELFKADSNEFVLSAEFSNDGLKILLLVHIFDLNKMGKKEKKVVFQKIQDTWNRVNSDSVDLLKEFPQKPLRSFVDTDMVGMVGCASTLAMRSPSGRYFTCELLDNRQSSVSLVIVDSKLKTRKEIKPLIDREGDWAGAWDDLSLYWSPSESEIVVNHGMRGLSAQRTKAPSQRWSDLVVINIETLEKRLLKTGSAYSLIWIK